MSSTNTSQDEAANPQATFPSDEEYEQAKREHDDAKALLGGQSAEEWNIEFRAKEQAIKTELADLSSQITVVQAQIDAMPDLWDISENSPFGKLAILHHLLLSERPGNGPALTAQLFEDKAKAMRESEGEDTTAREFENLAEELRETARIFEASGVEHKNGRGMYAEMIREMEDNMDGDGVEGFETVAETWKRAKEFYRLSESE